MTWALSWKWVYVKFHFSHNLLMDCVFQDGCTLLLDVTMNNKPEMVKLLLDGGANPNSADEVIHCLNAFYVIASYVLLSINNAHLCFCSQDISKTTLSQTAMLSNVSKPHKKARCDSLTCLSKKVNQSSFRRTFHNLLERVCQSEIGCIHICWHPIVHINQPNDIRMTDHQCNDLCLNTSVFFSLQPNTDKC